MTEPTKISFAIQSFDITEQKEDSKFAKAKIQAFSSQANRHNLYCSEDVLKKTAPTIYETPIIYNWDKQYYKTDFGTHTDFDKSMIAGFIIPNSATFERLPDSRLTLSVDAKLWKNYVPQVLSVLKDKEGFSHVSVEMNLLDSVKRDDGLFEMKDFEYLGVCLLGDKITEAVPGANIQMLSFAEAKSEFEQSLKEDFSKSIDLSIPKKVKENAQKGLELHKKNSGQSSITLSVGRHLANMDVSTKEKVQHISKTHQSKMFRNMKETANDSNYVKYMLYGGQEGKDWSTKLCEQMDVEDNQQNTYFDTVTFPYNKRSDMNPALQGIDPPITAEQGSKIAEVADKIGSDKDKNGWAIAIAQFKKNHKVENGHWVEKESMDMEFDNIDEKDFAVKDDWGTGDVVTVDKSKDALSTSAWGSVNKTALMHTVLKAKNYKSLVHDVYMIVESGWEDHPSSSLKYPVMQISGGKAVYNSGGLSSALGYAEKNNESGVVSKVKAIQHKLGLGDSKDDEEKDSAKSGKEKMSMDEKEKQEEMAVAEKDKEKENPEEEKKEEEKEDPKEEKTESPKEEKKEEKEEDKKKMSMKMSLDAYLDVEAMLAFLEDETESYRELVAEFEKEPGQTEWGKVMAFCWGKMCKMAEDNKTFCQENMALKEFKASIEKQEYDFAVNSTIKDIENTVEIPKDEIDKLVKESEKYSLSTVDAWKNFAKATAFNFAKREKTPEETEHRIGLFWQNTTKPQTGTVWDRLK